MQVYPSHLNGLGHDVIGLINRHLHHLAVCRSSAIVAIAPVHLQKAIVDRLAHPVKQLSDGSSSGAGRDSTVRGMDMEARPRKNFVAPGALVLGVHSQLHK